MGAPAHHLPLQLSSFIGREREIAEVRRLLASSRLVTLTGAGGCGKTRLALQVAAQLTSVDLADGVCFASLAPLQSPPEIVPTLADTLGLKFSSGSNLSQQLLNYLAEKRLLLVMDNCEHLLSGIGLVADILQAAPHVRIIATSREQLNLHEEHIFQVPGLALPEGFGAEGALQSDAVKLFLQSARRVHPGFEPLPTDWPHLIHICRMTDGLPLALELAAAWVDLLSLADIAREVTEGMDLLAADWRDVPARQRSLRATFEHSWYLLNETEREVFAQLSVFRGGFTRDAAQRVAGASLHTLAALVRKSVLNRRASGRYDMHELLRQFAAEKLQTLADSGDLTGQIQQAQERHCACYLELLGRKNADLNGKAQLAALSEIEAEMDNVRAAWRWAATHPRVAGIAQGADSLSVIYVLRNWTQEGEAVFGQTARMLQSAELEPSREQAVTLAVVWTRQAFCNVWLGRLESARSLLQDSLALLRPLAARPEIAYALIVKAFVDVRFGEYETARAAAEEALVICRELGKCGDLGWALFHMGNVARWEGHFAESEQYLRAGLTTARECGSPQQVANMLNGLSYVLRLSGNLSEVKALLTECLAIARSLGYRTMEAYAMDNLGMLAYALGEYREARRYAAETLAMYQEGADRRQIAIELVRLGDSDCALGDYAAAQQHLRDSLQLSVEGQDVAFTLRAWVSIANLLMQTGDKAQAVELLSFAVAHRALEGERRELAQSLLAQLKATVATPVFDQAQARGLALDLDATSVRVLRELSELRVQPPSVAPPPFSRALDDLTTRELQVLRLLAQGLTDAQIAESLSIADRTVHSHLRSIYSKLDVSTRSAATRYALDHNLV